ncbi:unnamed protein product [Urochloa decumbens]|uniref:VQ domain-containing protein n=1 Tax=Urochloa decumbens TaxID=240449 RepID=A0ABC9FP88_9POAL
MSTAPGKVKRSSSSGGVVVGGLHGPRPQPLSLPAASPPRPSKRPRVNGGGGDDGAPPVAGPVIVYEHTPRVIHARPDEFKALVQRLTGRQQPAAASPEEEAAAAGANDPLVLTLGKQAPPPPLDHTPELPSPGGGLAGFLLSPGSFLFSPATMQALHELISS